MSEMRWWRWRAKTADGGFKSVPGWKYVETDVYGIDVLREEQREEHDDWYYRGIEAEPIEGPPREWLLEQAKGARNTAAACLRKADRYEALAARRICAVCGEPWPERLPTRTTDAATARACARCGCTDLAEVKP